METTPLLQGLIGQIANRHALDLSKPPFWLHLEQENAMPLLITSHEKNVLHVAIHNEMVEEDELSVALFVGGEAWMPIGLDRRLAGTAVYANMYEDNDRAVVKDKPLLIQPKGAQALPRTQAEAASFCQAWAQELRAQGWLDKGKRAK